MSNPLTLSNHFFFHHGEVSSVTTKGGEADF
jgi:hypothetical protein